MERHVAEIVVKVYAWLQWISGALGVFAALAFFFAPSVFGGIFTDNPALSGIFSGIGISAGIFVLVMSIFDIVVGTALWQRKSWARIAMIVLGVISLFAFPLGTLYGIITIYLFGFDDAIKSVFIKPIEAVHHVERRKKVRA